MRAKKNSHFMKPGFIKWDLV